MEKCSEYYVTKKTPCTTKKAKFIGKVCRYGCWKHQKNQKIYQCGRHSDHLCCYECVVCEKFNNGNIENQNGVLLELDNHSEYYCSQVCWYKNDRYDPDNYNPKTKLNCEKCIMCPYYAFGRTKVLCMRHAQYYSKLEQNLDFKSCNYSVYRKGGCYTRGWVSKDDLFWCDDHIADKEKLESNKFIVKPCKYNDFDGLHCNNIGTIEKNEDFWCNNHQKQKELYSNGCISTQCKYNELKYNWNSGCWNYGFVSNATATATADSDYWCEKHQIEKQNYKIGTIVKTCKYDQIKKCNLKYWVEKDQDFWCHEHHIEKQKYQNGKTLKRCKYDHLLESSRCRCNKQKWVNKDQDFWCKTHYNDKVKNENGFEARFCEYQNDLNLNNCSHDTCQLWRWNKKDTFWLCPKHIQYNDKYKQGLHIKKCNQIRKCEYIVNRCSKMIWTKDECAHAPPKDQDAYIISLLNEIKRLKGDVTSSP